MTRRFQFSLRALLVGVVIIASFLGGVRLGERREQERRRLADEREAQQRWSAIEAALQNPSMRGATIVTFGDDERDTTSGWRKSHAEAVETLGFDR